MKKKNQLTKLVQAIDKTPRFLRSFLLSQIIGKKVKFVGTAGLFIDVLNEKECCIILKNRRKVQNHIGSVHAAATALLAESATGFLTGMTVPDDRIILIKSMTLNYVRRSKGQMTARATFTNDQIQFIKETVKGDITVPVTITDETGENTVEATMIWAWTKKK